MTVCGSQQEFAVCLDTFTKMAFIKEESEDIEIEETLRVKQEDTEEQTVVFIKEESEVVKIEGTLRVKQEDTEEQTGWFSFSVDA